MVIRADQIFWSVFFAGILFMLLTASDGPVANAVRDLIKGMESSAAGALRFPAVDK